MMFEPPIFRWRFLCTILLLAALALLLTIGDRALVAAPPAATVVSGTIAADETWTLANSPYVLQGGVNVAAGATLTIEPGVEVRGDGTNAEINVLSGATLVADGTAQAPIRFTTHQDIAEPGQWQGINLQTGSSARIAHCEIGYAGVKSPTNSGYPLWIQSSDVEISDCDIHHSAFYGVNIQGDGVTPHLENVAIRTSGFANDGLPEAAIRQGRNTFPIYHNLTLTDNAIDAVQIPAGSWFNSGVLDSTGLNGAPLRVGSMTIHAGVALTIAAGTTIALEDNQFIAVSGSLTAAGTRDQPIVFTAAAENPQPGQWHALFFEAGSTVRLDECEIAFGGSSRHAVEIRGGDVRIEHCHLHDNQGDAVRVANQTQPVINFCRIERNGFGVRNDTPETTIDATNNWWGHPSGPNNPEQNPSGQGDGVTIGIDFDPWLPTDNSDATPVTASPTPTPTDPTGNATATPTLTPTVAPPIGDACLQPAGATAFQSSLAYDGAANRACDGVTDGDYSHDSVSHTGYELNPWWQLDLGSVRQIDAITIWNRTDGAFEARLADYYLFISDAPIVSNEPDAVRNQPGVSAYYQVEAPDPATTVAINRSGRYIRIHLAGRNFNYLHLAEVQINTGDATPAPTPPDLLAWYPFDGNAQDASGNGNHGTPMNGVAITADRLGTPNRAYQFDGVDDVIVVPDSATLDIGARDFSLVAWARIDAARDSAILAKIEQLSQSAGYGLLTTAQSARVQAVAASANAARLYGGPTELGDGRWHCVAAVFDWGNQAAIYIDSRLDFTYGDLPPTALDVNNALDLRIGASTIPFYKPFHGALDDLRIYGYALSATQVADLCATDDQSPTPTPTATATQQPTATPIATPTPRPTTSAPDIMVTALEITQGIQNLANDMPLVQDRVTWARAYVRSSQGNISGIRARLRAFYDGQELAASPILAENQPITVYENGGNRLNIDDTFLFYIPTSWRTGQVRFTVEVNYDAAVPESNLGNNSFSQEITFAPGQDLELVFVPLTIYDYNDLSPHVYDMTHFTFPQLVNNLYRSHPIARMGIQQTRPMAVDYAPDSVDAGVRLLKQIELARRFSSRYPVGAHWLGMVHPATNTGNLYAVSYRPGLSAWTRMSAGHQGGPDWFSFGGSMVAHVLGHNKGLQHVDCAGNEGKVDSEFPYARPNCSLSAIDPAGYFGFDAYFQTWGLDAPTVISNDPAAPVQQRAFPLMGYQRPLWISPYAYCKLLPVYGIPCAPDTPVVTTAGFANEIALVQLPPDADEYVIASGFIDPATTSATLEEVYRSAASPGTAAVAGEATDYTLVVLDSGGIELAAQPIQQFVDEAEAGAQPFVEVVAVAGAAAKIQVRQSDAVVAERSASANAPTVEWLAPSAGASLQAGDLLTWQGADADGDALSYDLLYSADDGVSWQVLVQGWPNASYPLTNLAGLPGGEQVRLRVIANDGFDSAAADSALLRAPDAAPIPVILEPALDIVHRHGQLLILQGYAADAEDGVVAASALTWSSSLDGALGTGGELPVRDLTVGEHVITLRAVDANGASAQTSTVVRVVASGPLYLPLISR